MSRRSKVDAEEDRIFAKIVLERVPEEIQAGTDLEKALFLRSHGFSKRSVSDVTGVAVKNITRAEDAKALGRPISTRGRPGYLTKTQEDELEVWIRQQNLAGLGPSIDEVNYQATNMAQERWRGMPVSKRPDTEPDPPSGSWYHSYLMRRPTLGAIMAKPMEKARHDNATTQNISAWFNDVLLPVFAEHKYDCSMVANCDETMVQFSANNKLKIIMPKLGGYAHVREEPQLQHITFVPTIFADGARATTLIIYPMKTVPQEYSLDKLSRDEDFAVAGQSQGWIDKSIFEQYCLKSIIPKFEKQRLKIDKPDARGLLIVDGHSSRMNANLMDSFEANGIDVVSLVSHTSHVSQPLDAIVFSVFKQNLQKNLRQCMAKFRKDVNKLRTLELFEKTVSGLITAPDAPSLNVSIFGDEETEVLPDMEVPVEQELDDTVNGLSSRERRYVLVMSAKKALHMSFYEENIFNSFSVTGIYPCSLETALQRKDVRDVPIVDGYAKAIAQNKQTKRVSINGMLITSVESRAVMRAVEQKAQEKAAAKAAGTKKVGRPRKNQEQLVPTVL